MAIQLEKENSKFNIYEQHFLIDSESELQTLESEYTCRQGDKAELPDGSYYIRHSDDYQGEKWELAKSSGGGGGSDLPPVTSADNGDLLGVVNGTWNKTDPPYSVTETTQTIIALQNATTTASGGYGNISMLDGNLSPVAAGDTCVITFNGTDYTLIAGSGGLPGLGVYLGEIDPESQGLPWTFANYPFFITTLEGTPALFTETAGTYAIAVTATVKTVTPTNDFTRAVKAITGAPTVRVVNLIYADDTITADQDYDTIISWMSVGDIVLMHDNITYVVAQYHNTIEWVCPIYMTTNGAPYLSLISYQMQFDGTVTVDTQRIDFAK